MSMFYGKGNLGDSPTFKTVKGREGEFDVASMRVMFGRHGDDGQGGVEQVDGYWREVEVYGFRAKECSRLLRKGMRIMVYGEERSFTAHDDDGKEVTAFKIVATDVGLQMTSRLEGVNYKASTRQKAAAEA